MKTRILPAADLAPALEILRQGGIVAFPTDTVYGLGALAFDNAAIESLYSAKDRPVEKAIPVLIADLADLEKVAIDLPVMAQKLAARFWPGPLTCVVPKHPSLPPAVSASATVAVRIPDHPAARALLRAAGPMAVTSANLSGQASPCSAREVLDQLEGRIPDHPAARALLRAAGPMAVTSANLSGQASPCSAREVLDQLEGRIPLILDGGLTPGGVPSTLVDCTGPEPVILRAGPLSLENLLQVL